MYLHFGCVSYRNSKPGFCVEAELDFTAWLANATENDANNLRFNKLLLLLEERLLQRARKVLVDFWGANRNTPSRSEVYMAVAPPRHFRRKTTWSADCAA